METQREIERIARLKSSDVGPTEENVKQKIIVPLLELLGHKRDALEFEFRTRRGGKIDILIGDVGRDCKVVIDTKNYSENLSDHVEQIREYTFDEAALIAVIANGTEMRLYSPLRGIAFERSLLYSIRRDKLSEDAVWRILSGLIGYDNLKNRSVLRAIEDREKEIKDVMLREEHIGEELRAQTERIDADVEQREEDIADLKSRKEQLERDANGEISRIWQELGLPMATSSRRSSPEPGPVGPIPPGTGKARKVRLEELVKEGLLRDGATLYFAYAGLHREEEATVIASLNKLRYKGDNKTYSISKLAEILLKKHGFKHDDHGVAGPIYWRTSEGKLLDDLNKQIRARYDDLEPSP